MTTQDKIQAVINTIERVKIDATYDNMNRLLGALQTLNEVYQELTPRPENVQKIPNTDEKQKKGQ